MAAHPNPQYPQRIGEPDCRDYLRTGRCKYGESCKYHHPPNVQSGGGIKTPLDPSEPPFPIRPGEPPCQYYLKHGTCKFGQTCKFHHPPHFVTTASTGGLTGAVMMNVINASQGNTGQQIIALNSGETTLGELQTQVLQLLPQRPGEPDCIYFLRNGRCKYGATCKYHHPIDGRQQHRQQEHSYVQIGTQGRHGRHRSFSAGSTADTGTGGHASVQFVHSPGVGHGSFGQRKGEPTHILLSEGPIRVMAINQGSTSRNTGPYQQASNNSSPAITSSSVASSYETAVSNLDYIPASAHGQYHHDCQVQMDSSGRYWRRTGSREQLESVGGGGSPRASHGNLQRLSSAHRGGVSSPQASHGNLQCLSSAHHGGVSHGRAPVNRSSSMDADRGQHQQISSLRRAAEAGRALQQDPRQHSTAYGGSVMFSSNADAAYSQGRGGPRWSSSASASTPARTGGSDRRWDDGGHTAFVRSAAYEGSLGQGFLSSSAPEYFPDQFGDRVPQPPASIPGRGINEANRRQGHPSRYHGAGADPDDGLSMMTSALLTMLDTPDGKPQGQEAQETGAEDNSYSTASTAKTAPSLSYLQEDYPSSGPSTPRQSGASLSRSPSLTEDMTRIDGMGNFLPPSQYTRMPQNRQEASQIAQEYGGGTYIPSYSSRSSSQGSAYLPSGGTSIASREDDHSPPNTASSGAAPAKWSPTWHNSKLPGHQMEQNAQSVSALQQGPGAAGHNHAPHNGGLFLP